MCVCVKLINQDKTQHTQRHEVPVGQMYRPVARQQMLRLHQQLQAPVNQTDIPECVSARGQSNDSENNQQPSTHFTWKHFLLYFVELWLSFVIVVILIDIYSLYCFNMDVNHYVHIQFLFKSEIKGWAGNTTMKYKYFTI